MQQAGVQDFKLQEQEHISQRRQLACGSSRQCLILARLGRPAWADQVRPAIEVPAGQLLLSFRAVGDIDGLAMDREGHGYVRPESAREKEGRWRVKGRGGIIISARLREEVARRGCASARTEQAAQLEGALRDAVCLEQQASVDSDSRRARVWHHCLCQPRHPDTVARLCPAGPVSLPWLRLHEPSGAGAAEEQKKGLVPLPLPLDVVEQQQPSLAGAQVDGASGQADAVVIGDGQDGRGRGSGSGRRHRRYGPALVARLSASSCQGGDTDGPVWPREPAAAEQEPLVARECALDGGASAGRCRTLDGWMDGCLDAELVLGGDGERGCARSGSGDSIPTSLAQQQQSDDGGTDEVDVDGTSKAPSGALAPWPRLGPRTQGRTVGITIAEWLAASLTPPCEMRTSGASRFGLSIANTSPLRQSGQVRETCGSRSCLGMYSMPRRPDVPCLASRIDLGAAVELRRLPLVSSASSGIGGGYGCEALPLDPWSSSRRLEEESLRSAGHGVRSRGSSGDGLQWAIPCPGPRPPPYFPVQAAAGRTIAGAGSAAVQQQRSLPVSPSPSLALSPRRASRHPVGSVERASGKRGGRGSEGDRGRGRARARERLSDDGARSGHASRTIHPPLFLSPLLPARPFLPPCRRSSPNSRLVSPGAAIPSRRDWPEAAPDANCTGYIKLQ
ncbi:hypothetical protein CDD83_2584 [Cordyceps sp. RAO-2017]|nr:hypothetical protein CDD83_2584 [Cordyceps sp. RAO-2017]